MTQNTPAEAGKAHDTHDTHGFRRKMVGRVISAKMKKTVSATTTNAPACTALTLR